MTVMTSTKIRHNLSPVAQTILHDSRGAWSLIAPEATTNLVINPSFENGATGWTLVEDGASTFGVSTTEVYFGGQSGSLFRSGGTEAYVYTDECSVSPSSMVTISCYLKSTTPLNFGLSGFEYTAGSVLIRQMNVAMPKPTTEWQRLVFTQSVTAGTGFVRVLIASSGNGTCYIDGVQLEVKPYPTTYCDGDQAGCEWQGIAHESASDRLAGAYQGGRVWSLDAFKFKVASVVGTAAPALNTIATPYALIGGGFYQRTVTPIRIFTIAGGFECDSLIDLSRNRAALISALMPRIDDSDARVRLIYAPTDCENDLTAPVLIDAVFTGGLEGLMTNDLGRENAALGFQVFNSFGLFAQNERNDSATFAQTVSHSSSAYETRNLINGRYRPQSSAVAAPDVLAVAVASRSRFYIGGSFSTGGLSGIGQGDITGGVVAFDGMDGGADATVRALAIGPDGNLYAGGDFGNIGGGAALRLAVWDGSSWAQVGGGANSVVRALKFTSNGSLLVAGDFTSLNGGGTSAAGFAALDVLGGWSALATSLGGTPRAIAQGLDGTVYLGGNINSVTLANSILIEQVTALNPITGLYDSMQGGLLGSSNIVYALLVGPDGLLYAGGSFSSDGLGNVRQNIATWNGAAWSPVGSGTDGAVRSLTLMPNGEILVTGSFTSAGGVACNGVAIWTGSSWAAYDIRPETSKVVLDADVRSDLLVMGGDFTVENVPEPITVTVGGGSPVAPVLRLSNGANVRMLVNWTTGQKIYFNNVSLLSNEIAVLTFGNSPTFISNFNGNIRGSILPGSDLSSFRLVPGENILSLDLYAGDASIYWREGHITLDSVLN